MQANKVIANLIFKQLQGDLNPEEQAQFSKWLEATEGNRLIYEEVSNEYKLSQTIQILHPDNWRLTEQRMLDRIAKETYKNPRQVMKPTKTSKRVYWMAAASVLVILITGAYFIQQHRLTAAMAAVNYDVDPGKEGAILILGDGKEIVLEKEADGFIASQNGVNLQIKDGRLAYDPTAISEQKATYNTVKTPKGRQFQIVLSDGTMVWLNAESSIKYPTTFSGATRRVEVEGEVMMEIAKNAKQPFFVQVSGDQEIEVLGTSFNINAYMDRGAVYTTLLEGAVRITKKEQQVTLKPKEQLKLNVQTGGFVVNALSDKSLDNALAWRNGFFNFDGATFEEVVLQLERWYDVEISYDRKFASIEFGGELDRKVPLSSVLKAIESDSLKFKFINKNKIEVVKKQ